MSSGFQLARRQADAYESFTSTFMEGSARLLVDRASIRTGDVVLDLACGTGLVARHALARAVPGGRVSGADLNSAMIDVARDRCGSEVDWVVAPCEALPFDDGTFTHVICQQGVQFFPDPGAALTEARRVLRPDGTLLATVWATPGHNPYIEHQLDLLAARDPAVAASTARATPAHADDLLVAAAEAAGLVDISVDLLEHTVDIVDFGAWFLAQTGGTPWGPTIAAMSDAGRDEIASAMTARMEPYATSDDRFSIPFCSFLLTAHRSVAAVGAAR